ncbi:hypothetical protein VCUG_00476 [Vavraia culicis subsp. floridensis]|uniref:Uncharacterized protein n=1 Tax=Vavraia culicis (isolate floridensis) TaxID=948595 RepID=L2GXM7_VAVCU|nr:uncharacterized protein VCUG_00476 [Vavraia culicis subsp. floridensis]ELA48053.1 hypothetical protein VCUG_00476 [Vavraia culicis subsp. floridensis]
MKVKRVVTKFFIDQNIVLILFGSHVCTKNIAIGTETGIAAVTSNKERKCVQQTYFMVLPAYQHRNVMRQPMWKVLYEDKYCSRKLPARQIKIIDGFSTTFFIKMLKTCFTAKKSWLGMF